MDVMIKAELSRFTLRCARSIVPLVLMAAALGACQTTQEDITSSVPSDYRQRHPVVVQEADRTVEVFVGTGRGCTRSAGFATIAAMLRCDAQPRFQ